MKMTVVRPNVEKFQIRLEPGDPLYHKCMWADILLDYDAYSITAQADCGDYSHRWPATDKESFRDLCLRMLCDDDYLLGKFSDRSEFSIDKSRRLFFDYYEDDPDMHKDVQTVREATVYNDYEWVELLEEIGISEPWEYIVKEFPSGAKVFVQLLRDFILPELRKERDQDAQ